jgi:hypothetical protein
LVVKAGPIEKLLDSSIAALKEAIKQQSGCVWPTHPLTKVQVNINGVSRMAEPERAYFDATSVNDAVEAIKQQGEPVLWVDPETGDTSYIRPLRPTYIPLYREAPTIPDDWQLVPKEPTPEMSAFQATAVHFQIAERIYKAMLSAAPEYKEKQQ